MGKKSRRNRGNDAQQRKAEKKMAVKPLTGSTQNLANMIFYPEVALEESATPSGASVRGTVGHNAMFEVGLHIFEKRMQLRGKRVAWYLRSLLPSYSPSRMRASPRIGTKVGA